MKFRSILYIILGIPVFLSLLWLFAVPTDLIQERIEGAIASSGNGAMSLSVTGLRKGPFMDLSADNLTLVLDQKPALEIENFKLTLALRQLFDFRFAVAVNGEMGGGRVHGTVKLPVDGTIDIERAELNRIPYLKRTGLEVHGTLSSRLVLKGDSVRAEFQIPDLSIPESTVSVVPLLSSFRTMQGSLFLTGNNLEITSVSLEGDKGYARLKGAITDGIMNLSLELMPEGSKLNAMESMIIGKYIVSPGYYLVPIRGQIP